jgi:glycosyltransferase involved in cell wall biosynthesis
MSAERAAAAVTERQEAGARRRVLILRSCRPVQFADALRFARQRHPHAEIVVLSHYGHRDALLASGVDRVIEIPGRRFSAFRMALWTLRRLRFEPFDEIVIPQMTPLPRAHLNLYWLAVALRSQRVTVLPGEQAPWEFSRSGFLRFVRMQAFGWLIVLFDMPLFLALLLAACVIRRQHRPAAADRRRRVLHIIPGCGAGDAPAQLAELIKRTPTDRYDVEVLVLGHHGEFARDWVKRGVEVTFLEHWPRMTRSAFVVRNRCRSGQYDIVHTWLFMANVVGAAGARLAGVPCVIASVRDLSMQNRGWWFRLAGALGSFAADVVTVNARALMRDQAQRTWVRQSRIEMVHDGLDPSHFLADRRGSRHRLLELTRAPGNAVLVGIAGPLAHETDHVTFLRLLARVRKGRPDVHGIVIGDGELRPHLESVAGKLGLSSDVTFLGERPEARMLMAGLDLFVLTSRNEGFADVLLEATFLGVPCVAADIGGNPDVLDSRESLFAPGDIWTGAARVLALLDAPSEAAEPAGRIRQRAFTMFTADRTAAAWLDLYDQCLKA